MKKINTMSAICFVVVSLFVSILAGCHSGIKKEVETQNRVEHFLKNDYGKTTAEKMWIDTAFKPVDNAYSFNDLDYKINDLKLKCLNTKEVGASTLHFVKGKMTYRFKHKNGDAVVCSNFVRYMALTIKEDGFGKMRVMPLESVEYFASGPDEKMLKELFAEVIDKGEKLIE